MAGILSIILIALPWLGALLIWLIGDSRPKILHALSVGICLAAGLFSLTLLAFTGAEAAVRIQVGGLFGVFTLIPDGLGASLAAVAASLLADSSAWYPRTPRARPRFVGLPPLL